MNKGEHIHLCCSAIEFALNLADFYCLYVSCFGSCTDATCQPLLRLKSAHCCPTCRPLVSKELPIETKAFYFETGENTRGRFLRVSESGAG